MSATPNDKRTVTSSTRLKTTPISSSTNSTSTSTATSHRPSASSTASARSRSTAVTSPTVSSSSKQRPVSAPSKPRSVVDNSQQAAGRNVQVQGVKTTRTTTGGQDSSNVGNKRQATSVGSTTASKSQSQSAGRVTLQGSGSRPKSAASGVSIAGACPNAAGKVRTSADKMLLSVAPPDGQQVNCQQQQQQQCVESVATLSASDNNNATSSEQFNRDHNAPLSNCTRDSLSLLCPASLSQSPFVPDSTQYQQLELEQEGKDKLEEEEEREGGEARTGRGKEALKQSDPGLGITDTVTVTAAAAARYDIVTTATSSCGQASTTDYTCTDSRPTHQQLQQQQKHGMTTTLAAVDGITGSRTDTTPTPGHCDVTGLDCISNMNTDASMDNIGTETGTNIGTTIGTTSGGTVTVAVVHDNTQYMKAKTCSTTLEDEPHVIVTSQCATESRDSDESLAERCARLERERSALSELLCVKKAELDNTQHRYTTKLAELEDLVCRLKADKDRLLDRLQLPESERSSLVIEEKALSEMRQKLQQSEQRVEQLKAENIELREELDDTQLAMNELHDQFQAEESLELRELQRELDNTSRDCRLLHFKLRKAERRNDELKIDCEELEQESRRLVEQLHQCQQELRRLKSVEDELKTAKEISITLHDECERLDKLCQTYRQQLNAQNSVGGTKNADIDTDSGDVSRSREMDTLRHELCQCRHENIDLLKAVSYLRTKLEKSRGNCASDVTNSVIHSSSSDDITLIPVLQVVGTQTDAVKDTFTDTSRAIQSHVDISADKISSLITENKSLTSQLESVCETNSQLENQVTSLQHQLDSMLETLNTKEQQHAAECQQLQLKNKQLSDVFDLFTERSTMTPRRNRRRKDQLYDVLMSCRSTDDVSTQTDDVSNTPVNTLQKWTAEKSQMEHILENLKKELIGKSQTISSQLDMIERQEKVMIQLTSSVRELEQAQEATNSRLELSSKQLEAKNSELMSLKDEKENKEQLLVNSQQMIRGLEERLKSVELMVAHSSRQYQETCRELQVKCKENERLRASAGELTSRTEELQQQVDNVSKERMQLQTQLVQLSQSVKDLNGKLETLQVDGAKQLKQQQGLYEDRVHKVTMENNALTHELLALRRQQQQQQQMSLNSLSTNTASNNGPASRKKLFNIEVKHEKSHSQRPNNFSVPENISNVKQQAAAVKQQKQQQQPRKMQQHLQKTVVSSVTLAVTSLNCAEGVSVTSHSRCQQSPDVALQTPLSSVTCSTDVTSQHTPASCTPAQCTPTVSTPNVRRRDRTTTSNVPASFRRSRSMTDVNILADNDLVYHVEPVDPLQLTLYTPCDVTTLPSPTCGPPPDVIMMASDHCDVVLRRRGCTTTSTNRGSFYASGTLSASASRDQSPFGTSQRHLLVTGRPTAVVRRICDYPLAPPSMIITPSRTPHRAASTDRATTRSHSTFNPLELIKRLSDVISDDVDVTSGHVSRGRRQERVSSVEIGPSLSPLTQGRKLQADGRSASAMPLIRQAEANSRSRAESQRSKGEGRSASVSPRTARRQFYEHYPPTSSRELSRPSCDVMTRSVDVTRPIARPPLVTSLSHGQIWAVDSNRDKTSSRLSVQSAKSQQPVGGSSKAGGGSRGGAARPLSVATVKQAALALFRRTKPHSKHGPSPSISPSPSANSPIADSRSDISSSSVVGEVLEGGGSLDRRQRTCCSTSDCTDGEITDSHLYHSLPLRSQFINSSHLLSLSQPIHCSTSTSVSTPSSSLPAAAAATTTRHHSSTLASIIDPLKRRTNKHANMTSSSNSSRQRLVMSQTSIRDP